jgi:penicillin-binding protein 1A
VIVAVAAIVGLSAVGWIVSVASSAPDIATLKPRDQGATSVVYDSKGQRLGFIRSTILRTPIPGSQIPQVLKDATVAIEDRRFFEHEGVDLEGIVRAAVKRVESGGEDIQGGSTLTMQLVRNLYTEDRARDGVEGFKRKIREAKLAEELENAHPGRAGKEWVLDKYVNNVPYGTVGGQSAIGIQAAARVFFDKPASKLKLHEAALLAGLPQQPSNYNPFLNPQGARNRRNAVLRRMADEGYVTPSEAQAAMDRDLGVKEGNFYRFRTEGYFFDLVAQQLLDEYDIDRVRRGGLRVYTTIDRDLQKKARAALNAAVSGQDRSAAVVSVDPANGQIKAMATTGTYGDFKYNLAAQGKYAPGSTFKTMGLMAALDQGVDPDATSYTSQPLKFNDPTYGPIDVKTYSGSYIGRANLVKATLTSDNSIYQQLALDLGPDKVAEAARRMGVKSKLNSFPAEILGGLEDGVSPLEMANSYATIASGGWRNRVTAITKVCFPEGASRFECRQRKRHRAKAFKDGVTDKARQILEKNVQSGTGTAARLSCPAAGKTGTTDDFTDAWFVGFTPKIATAVWVGHATDRRTLGPGSAGGTTAAPIWGAFMRSTGKRFCADWPTVREPFQAQPFFGKYAKTGVKGNKADDDYRIDGTGGTDLEQGRGGGTQGTTGRGRESFPRELYEQPPQDRPDPAPAPEPDPEPAPAPDPTAGAEGGAAPPP